MALFIQNSSTLIDPKNFKLKVLIYGLHGVGKTSWMSTAPNAGIGVSETGWGKGLLSVATKDLDFTELNSYADFDTFCSGTIFKDKETLCLDSLSDMVRTFVKDKALSIPRSRGESAKRLAGVMELDDFGVVAELTRKLLKKFIDQPKHIVVTSGLRIDRPDPENLQGETLIGPDLAGQLFLGSTAMFDLVFCLRTRRILRDPKDAKSVFMQRYIVTESNGSGIIAKNRLSIQGGKSFLPSEVIFDPDNNLGTFDYFYNLAISEYTRYVDEHTPKVVI